MARYITLRRNNHHKIIVGGIVQNHLFHQIQKHHQLNNQVIQMMYRVNLHLI